MNIQGVNCEAFVLTPHICAVAHQALPKSCPGILILSSSGMLPIFGVEALNSLKKAIDYAISLDIDQCNP